jgi:lipopolysaccharide export system protein LptC
MKSAPRGWRFRLERLIAFLPVLMLGVLALGSYWLYRQAPTIKETKVAPDINPEPDYFLKQFATRRFSESGRIKSEIYGEMAFHFPITDELDIRLIRMKKVQESNQILTGSAQQALSNQDASDVQLIGAAQLSQTPLPNAKVKEPTEFSGEYLRIQSNEEKVTSNRPVLVSRGNDKFSAASLQYDHKTQITEMQGRVSIVLWPHRKP